MKKKEAARRCKTVADTVHYNPCVSPGVARLTARTGSIDGPAILKNMARRIKT